MKRRIETESLAESLAEPVERARELAGRLGLDPYPVNFWIVDYDEMNQLIAYEGFQERYPHWRWGMQYDRQRKADRYRAGKAYEIVNNDNPAHAFLQESNARADQKAVITHVLAHADFFKCNEWFQTIEPDEPGAAAMVARHARRIRSYVNDPAHDREEIERWIDHVLCITDTIDQHRPFAEPETISTAEPEERSERRTLVEQLEELGVREEVRETVFGGLEDIDGVESDSPMDTPEDDVLAFLIEHGKQYDEEAGRAVNMEDWQREILRMLRTEAYYFAPQRMTKVMNEGWGAYWESLMMSHEGFADEAEVIGYADHLAKVLGSGGLNPYALGKHLWDYIENTANRKEVLERLLQVEGITWRSLSDVVDFSEVNGMLEPPEALAQINADTLDRLEEIDPLYVDQQALKTARDGDIDVDAYPWSLLTYEGLAWRNYSLCRPQTRGFLAGVTDSELERLDRYLGQPDRYPSVEAAIDDVDHAAGWDRMREVRRSHNDVTFLETFLTREFIESSEYFTYEFDPRTEAFRVASKDVEDIRQKLLLLFTNFGKPRISVLDGNFENRNELLLGHHYNGIALDLEAAKRTLERTFELWGRPVNLKTVVKADERETARDERGALLRYDGERIETERLPWSEVEDIADTGWGYDTTPAEWQQ